VLKGCVTLPVNPSADALYRDASRAAWLGLAINFALGIVKLTGGWLAQSFALLSDAVNSLGDGFTSLVVVYALRVAQRPPDAEHPYGHTRADSIAGSNIAVLVVVSALYVGWEAIQRLGTPPLVPPLWALGIAAANVVIKEGLFRYKVRVGKRTGSSALSANAWDHRSDALCSLAVLIGLGLVRWGGPAWSNADHIAALIVVAAVVWASVQLLRQCASDLMDVHAGDELMQEIRDTAATVPGVSAVEKLWVRKSGLEHFVDIHIQVDPHLFVAAGHEIGHRVKDRLVTQFASIRDVLVHLEPHPHAHAADTSTTHGSLQLETVVETALYADDLDAIERFYVHTLGLTVLAKEPGRHVFFPVGAGSVLLVFDPQATLKGDVLPAHGTRGPGHVAFGVAADQWEAWRTRLSYHGVTIEKEVTWPRGGRSVYFRDPAGNSVELITPGVWGLSSGW